VIIINRPLHDIRESNSRQMKALPTHLHCESCYFLALSEVDGRKGGGPGLRWKTQNQGDDHLTCLQNSPLMAAVD